MIARQAQGNMLATERNLGLTPLVRSYHRCGAGAVWAGVFGLALPWLCDLIEEVRAATHAGARTDAASLHTKHRHFLFLNSECFGDSLLTTEDSSR